MENWPSSSLSDHMTAEMLDLRPGVSIIRAMLRNVSSLMGIMSLKIHSAHKNREFLPLKGLWAT